MRYRKNSADKYRKSPRSRGPVPKWVVEAVDGGAQVYESGEHGFWSVHKGENWLSNADASRGKLFYGDDFSGDAQEIGEMSSAKAVAWLLGLKRNPRVVDLSRVDAKTLLKAYEHLKREKRGLYDTPEDEALVLMDLARELKRRGWKSGDLYARNPQEGSLDYTKNGWVLYFQGRDWPLGDCSAAVAFQRANDIESDEDIRRMSSTGRLAYWEKSGRTRSHHRFNPRRRNPKPKPEDRRTKAVKLVQSALEHGVILHFSTAYGTGTAGPYHTAVPTSHRFAIFRDYHRQGYPRSDFYSTAFGAADHFVEFVGVGNAINALKAAARKRGATYVNLETPIRWR